MKHAITFICIVAAAFANENANVLRHEAQLNVNDFKYAVQLDNSVNIQQEGSLQGEDTWVVNGQHSWTSPEGEPVSIQYVANENGYQVLAANPPLPTPPPIPEAIQRALAWIAAHPTPKDESHHRA